MWVFGWRLAKFYKKTKELTMYLFDKKYFISSLVLLSLLIYIALFVNDQFVRPFVGDVLVVIWLYSFLKSFIKINSDKLAHLVVGFSYLIEIGQYYNLVSILGLQHIKAARIIIGSTFDWLDLLGYTIGWGIILVSEYYRLKRKKNKKLNRP